MNYRLRPLLGANWSHGRGGYGATRSRSKNDRGAPQNTLEVWALIWILEAQLSYLPETFPRNNTARADG